MKVRLRTDLKSAMRTRTSLDVSVLRSLIAALDNAQAVPVGDQHARYVDYEFGDPSVEIPRLVLDAADVEAVLEREASEWSVAADRFEALGQSDKSAELRKQATIVARYLGNPRAAR